MSIIVKKISRNAVISAVSIFGVLIFMLAKLFFGMFGINMESKAGEAIKNNGLINPASADVISPDCGDCDCSNCCESQG